MLPGISFPLGILVVLGSAFIGGFFAGKLKLPTIRVYFGAFLQVVLTSFLGTMLLKNIFGLDLKVALIGAAAFSLSSTAMVVKFLQSKNPSENLPG